MAVRKDLQQRRDFVRDDESRVRFEESDPNRWRSGAVRGYGRNQDGTPDSAYNRAEAARLAQERAYMENEAAARAMATARAGMGGGAGGGAGASPGLVDVLKGITTADRNANYNVAPGALGNGISGVEATKWGDAYVRTGQAGQGMSIKDALAAAGQGMGAGGGVAVTESGRVIRVDPNHEYGVQQQIDDPETRAAVPSIAKANSDIERRSLTAKAMELASRGIGLPEGKALDSMTTSDLHAMAVQAAHADAQRQWRQDAMGLTKILAGMKTVDETGMERGLSPDEINRYVVSQLGEMPGAAQSSAKTGPDYAGLIAQEKARMAPQTRPGAAPARPAPAPAMPEQAPYNNPYEALAEAGQADGLRARRRVMGLVDLLRGGTAEAGPAAASGWLPNLSLLPEAIGAEAGQISELQRQAMERERRQQEEYNRPIVLSAVRG